MMKSSLLEIVQPDDYGVWINCSDLQWLNTNELEQYRSKTCQR